MWKNVKGISLLVRGGEVRSYVLLLLTSGSCLLYLQIQSHFYQLYFDHLSEWVQKDEMHLAMF